MMPLPIISNVKAPPATTSGTFGFVFRTTPRPQQKDAANDFYHIPRAPFKPHR